MEKIKFKNKLEFRAHAKERLLTCTNTYKRDKVVCHSLLGIISLLKPQTILLYIPLALEVNIASILPILRRKHKLYVPFMEGFSFKMVKYRLPLDVKKFNIKEPENWFWKRDVRSIF